MIFKKILTVIDMLALAFYIMVLGSAIFAAELSDISPVINIVAIVAFIWMPVRLCILSIGSITNVRKV